MADSATDTAMGNTMTVMHLINTLEWGGVRKHVLDLADGLGIHGVRSCIAAWIPPGDTLHEDSRVTHLPLYEKWNTIKSPAGFIASVRILRRLLWQEDVSILHMHSRYATLLGSLAIRGSSVRRVYTAHNTFGDMRWLPWYPSYVIVPGQSVREHFMANVRGSRNCHVQVIGHGVSIPVRTPTFPESSPRFCFAGRLCEEKGVRVLYNALLRLREEGGIFPVIDIIGDGHLLPWLQDRVKADFPGSPITLHGYLENPDDLIVRATALLFPSVRLDSAPYITLEAMALGVPVIASDLEVFRELIIPDVTGKVFHKGDSAALAKIMRQAMTETEAMRTMGMRGRELVRERHGIERMIAETAAFYRDVLLS